MVLTDGTTETVTIPVVTGGGLKWKWLCRILPGPLSLGTLNAFLYPPRTGYIRGDTDRILISMRLLSGYHYRSIYQSIVSTINLSNCFSTAGSSVSDIFMIKAHDFHEHR